MLSWREWITAELVIVRCGLRSLRRSRRRASDPRSMLRGRNSVASRRASRHAWRPGRHRGQHDRPRILGQFPGVAGGTFSEL